MALNSLTADSFTSKIGGWREKTACIRAALLNNYNFFPAFSRLNSQCGMYLTNVFVVSVSHTTQHSKQGHMNHIHQDFPSSAKG